MPRILFWLKVVITLTLGIAGVLKALDIHELQLSIYASGLVGLDLTPWVAKAVVATELLVALGLWIPRTAVVAATGSALLSALFMGYSAWRWYFGIQVPCHCFGPLFTMPPTASAAISGGLLCASVEVVHNLRSRGVADRDVPSVPG